MSQWTGYGPDNVLHTAAGMAGTRTPQGVAAGTLTYEPFYGLQAKPFSVSTDPRALYKSPSHAAVLEDLLAAIRRREGLIVLTGEMGTGKTTLCRAALYQLDRKIFATFVTDPSLSREDLLRMLLVGFGEVSVDDLKQGRLKGTPRADLGCQLYEFLTSLESVDAFAVLVIDEAQRLAQPLLDEIRALSELEAGRRLLQIVLVGQPELRARLALPEMAQIAQRVTTLCELGPLTREGVGGYVSHRLSVAGGARNRVEFAQASLDLVFGASRGIPRLVNRICDRALFHGHLDGTATISRSQVAKALHDLDLVAPRVSEVTPAPGVEEPAVAARPVTRESATPGGLFTNRSASTGEASSGGSDLKALLDLPPVSRRTGETTTASTVLGSPAAARRSATRRHWLRRGLTLLGLPALGMVVMLVTGGLAVSIVGSRPFHVDLPALPQRPSPPRVAALPAIAPTAAETSALAVASPAPAVADANHQTWVVQVAAFSSPDRAEALVRRLTAAGMPAYETGATQGAPGPLTFVRVGPFPSAGDADAVRDRLRSTPDYEGAFVRNITSH